MSIAAIQDDGSIFFWQAPIGDLHMHAYYNEPSNREEPIRLKTSLQPINNTSIAATA